jgi:hypothetical protein
VPGAPSAEDEAHKAKTYHAPHKLHSLRMSGSLRPLASTTPCRAQRELYILLSLHSQIYRRLRTADANGYNNVCGYILGKKIVLGTLHKITTKSGDKYVLEASGVIALVVPGKLKQSACPEKKL